MLRPKEGRDHQTVSRSQFSFLYGMSASVAMEMLHI